MKYFYVTKDKKSTNEADSELTRQEALGMISNVYSESEKMLEGIENLPSGIELQFGFIKVAAE